MRKTLLPLAAVAAVCLPAAAQTGLTTITASKLQMAGHPITQGTVMLTPVDRLGTPTAFAGGDGSENGPMAFPCAIVNGAITGMIQDDGVTVSGTCQVPDSTLTTPALLLYSVTITDTSTGLKTSGKAYVLQAVVGVSGTTWALDHYGPAAQTTGLALVSLPLPAATVPTACSAPSFFTRTSDDSIWSCVAGHYVQATGTGGGSSAFAGGTLTLPLVLAGDPTTALGAATKQYVDAHAGSVSSTVPVTTATCSSTYALSFPTSGDIAYDITLAANCALTIAPPTATGMYQRMTLVIRPAGFQATLPVSSSTLVWAGGSAPVPSTSGFTVLNFGSTSAAPVFGGI